MKTWNSKRLNELAMSSLLAFYLEDMDHVAACAREIGDDYGWRGMAHSVLYWAQMAHEATGLTAVTEEEEAFVTLLGTIDMETGAITPIDEGAASETTKYVLRIFTCCGNKDYRTAADLFGVAVNNDHGPQVVSAMLQLCTELMRDKLDKRRHEIQPEPGRGR